MNRPRVQPRVLLSLAQFAEKQAEIKSKNDGHRAMRRVIAAAERTGPDDMRCDPQSIRLREGLLGRCGEISLTKNAEAQNRALVKKTLRSFAPAREVVFLLRRKPVDFHGHRFQLHLGDLLVERFRYRIDALFE